MQSYFTFKNNDWSEVMYLHDLHCSVQCFTSVDNRVWFLCSPCVSVLHCKSSCLIELISRSNENTFWFVVSNSVRKEVRSFNTSAMLVSDVGSGFARKPKLTTMHMLKIMDMIIVVNSIVTMLVVKIPVQDITIFYFDIRKGVVHFYFR